MIDVLLDFVTMVLDVLVSALTQLFELLFFWLPDDPLAGYLSDLSFTVSSLGTGLHWLNWLIDVNFFADAVALVTGACIVYVGWSLLKELFMFISSIRQSTI